VAFDGPSFNPKILCLGSFQEVLESSALVDAWSKNLGIIGSSVRTEGNEPMPDTWPAVGAASIIARRVPEHNLSRPAKAQITVPWHFWTSEGVIIIASEI
jgi:hypothetical protein